MSSQPKQNWMTGFTLQPYAPKPGALPPHHATMGARPPRHAEQPVDRMRSIATAARRVSSKATAGVEAKLTRKRDVLAVLRAGGRIQTRKGVGLAKLYSRGGVEIEAWQNAIKACLPLCTEQVMGPSVSTWSLTP